MDSKILIKAVKIAVREVIKEELAEILREGLQPTISEMKNASKSVKVPAHETQDTTTPVSKKRVMFEENKWASVLNETDVLQEPTSGLSSLAEMMNEGMDEIRMTSADAIGFGAMRDNMRSTNTAQLVAPKVMEDPETGKTFEVPVEIQQVMTRDYSGLMKAINKKKGR